MNQDRKKIKTLDDRVTVYRTPISKFIDTEFRKYGVYVLKSRGIPSFSDGLTDVQRFILKNTPTHFVKTLIVIGGCIADKYKHGDSALDSATSRMARTFGNSMQILDGDGEFGHEVCPHAAAPRYTRVRLSKQTHEYLKKYDILTTRSHDEPYDPFWLDCPIGLAIPIIGIAVGYKTVILPRDIKEIEKFVNGESADLTPYVRGFKGKFTNLEGNRKWLITPYYKVDKLAKTVVIDGLPPMLTYSAASTRFNAYLEPYMSKLKVKDSSNARAIITIQNNGLTNEEFEEVTKLAVKAFSVIVTESFVFVKDAQVLEYDNIESYLTEWKWQGARVKYRFAEKSLGILMDDLKYIRCKREFIKFMLSGAHTIKEIDKFVKKYGPDINAKLSAMSLRKLSTDEYESCDVDEADIIDRIMESERLVEVYKDAFAQIPEPKGSRESKASKVTTTLMDRTDIVELDGIANWVLDDELLDNELNNDGN